MLAQKQDLAINKGNSIRYKVKLVNQNGNMIILEDDAMLYFTVKESPYSDEYVFQKYIGNGITFSNQKSAYLIEITADETDPLFYKDYFYDITAVRNIGVDRKKEKTTVLVGNFTVGHVATLKSNEVTSNE